MSVARGKLTLVGAGPGDPDLLTLKGWRALQTADVVLYDALSNEKLLDFVPKTAKKIFVGKRAGKHRIPQEATNRLIVEHALQGAHVVRLKGGDPFVFGRGHEEMEYVQIFNIRSEYIPGISSCIAVPALQNVPLTRRGINESFWVLTATTRQGKLSKDIALAAQSTATLVILMGIRKLPQISLIFKELGKGETPVMVVQNGSLPTEKKVIATMNTIVEQAYLAEIGTPGIIVIGEVVKLHPELNYAYIETENKSFNRSVIR